MNLYASVSKIDQFRKLLTEDYVSEEGFIRDIKGESKVGWAATYGSALHACIEDPARWKVGDRYEWRDPYGPEPGPFDRAIVWPAEIVEACHAAWPKPCIWEGRIPEVTWKVGQHELVTAGRTDATYGTVIVEGKTRFGPVDLSSWTDALQWKFYLHAQPWATGCQYRIHEIGGMDSDDRGELHITRGGPRLKEIHAWTQWRQPGLEAELQKAVTEFVAFCESRGLLPYLKRWEPKP